MRIITSKLSLIILVFFVMILPQLWILTVSLATETAIVNYDVPGGQLKFATATGTITGYTGSPTNVVIPSTINGIGVTNIGESAFNNCSYSLTSISIPSSVTAIGNQAFYGCRALTAITVDASNPTFTSQNGVLFNKARTTLIRCPGGKNGSYSIPSSVTSIGSWAFEECKNITSVSIPNSVTNIREYAFLMCTGLTMISIPESVTSIDTCAFFYCSNLSAANFYGNAPLMGSGVFSVTKSVFTVYYLSSKSGFTNPWNGYPTAVFDPIVTRIPVTSITLTGAGNVSTITTNGGRLQMVASVLPANASNQKVRWNVSQNGLAQISNSGELETFGNRNGKVTVTATADDGSGVIGTTEITINDGIVNYDVPGGQLKFATATGTIIGYTGKPTDVVIPSKIDGVSVTSIGGTEYSAFMNCISLTSISIPNSVTSIGILSFVNCPALTAFTVDLGNRAFTCQDGVLFNKEKTTLLVCPGAKNGSYCIPDSVITVEWAAFDNCSITDISIPNSVTSIGCQAFTGCFALTLITVDSNNSAFSSQDGVLFDKTKTRLIRYPCTKKGSYSIPSSVISLDYGAFSGSLSLTSINIPNSVINIEAGVFQNCSSLTSIIIPNSVTSIGDNAFSSCTILNDVVLPNNLTSIEEGLFEYCINLTSISIPDHVTKICVGAFVECANLQAAYFFGNAPIVEPRSFGNSFYNGARLTFYYLEGKTGFTNPWNGYPAQTFTAGTPVPLEKEWRIKFNHPVDANTLQNNIVIRRTDVIFINEDSFSITPILDPNDSNVVIVKHFEPFVAGATYELSVNVGVKDVSGKPLSKTSGLTFMTQAQ